MQTFIDNVHVNLVDPQFEALVAEVPYDKGGEFSFAISAGSAYAHMPYMILQGLSGFEPGFYLAMNTFHVPLNWDVWSYTALTLNPYWVNFYGILDHEGSAMARMSTFGALPETAKGEDIQLLVLILDSNGGFRPYAVTNPVNVLITHKKYY